MSTEIELRGTDDESLRRAAAAALEGVGVRDGHLCVQLVGPAEIAALNRRWRGVADPTDVLAFPVDGTTAQVEPRELGDVVICPALTESLHEALVHGVLHLCGYDHETDRGEMLALQRRVMSEL